MNPCFGDTRVVGDGKVGEIISGAVTEVWDIDPMWSIDIFNLLIVALSWIRSSFPNSTEFPRRLPPSASLNKAIENNDPMLFFVIDMNFRNSVVIVNVARR